MKDRHRYQDRHRDRWQTDIQRQIDRHKTEKETDRHRVKLTCTISNSHVCKKIIQRWYNKYKDMKSWNIQKLWLHN